MRCDQLVWQLYYHVHYTVFVSLTAVCLSRNSDKWLIFRSKTLRSSFTVQLK